MKLKHCSWLTNTVLRELIFIHQTFNSNFSCGDIVGLVYLAHEMSNENNITTRPKQDDDRRVAYIDLKSVKNNLVVYQGHNDKHCPSWSRSQSTSFSRDNILPLLSSLLTVTSVSKRLPLGFWTLRCNQYQSRHFHTCLHQHTGNNATRDVCIQAYIQTPNKRNCIISERLIYCEIPRKLVMLR